MSISSKNRRRGAFVHLLIVAGLSSWRQLICIEQGLPPPARVKYGLSASSPSSIASSLAAKKTNHRDIKSQQEASLCLQCPQHLDILDYGIPNRTEDERHGTFDDERKVNDTALEQHEVLAAFAELSSSILPIIDGMLGLTVIQKEGGNKPKCVPPRARILQLVDDMCFLEVHIFSELSCGEYVCDWAYFPTRSCVSIYSLQWGVFFFFSPPWRAATSLSLLIVLSTGR